MRLGIVVMELPFPNGVPSFSGDVIHYQLLQDILVVNCTDFSVSCNCVSVQLCSKRMDRLLAVTNVNFYEMFMRVNSVRSKAMQRCLFRLIL